MSYDIKFMSLQKVELEYEVAIRGETPGSTVQELRRQIAKCGLSYPSEDILTSPFESTVDLDGVLEALDKVSTTISTTTDKSALLRAQNLLNHIYHRLHRISVTEKVRANYDECVTLYKEHRNTIDTLLDTATDPLGTTNNDPPLASNTLASPLNIKVTCEGNISNLFAKLKFDGKSCVRSFLQRVDEFCLAKNVTTDKVLKNAIDIFQGDAIHWYRSVKETVETWEELAVKLKRDFSLSDYDYRLLNEIRCRTQGEKENIVIYLSIMSGLFARLSKEPSEEDKLEILLHNIRPHYANTLSAVSSITSIDELRTLCRNYENVQSRLSHFKEPLKANAETLAPDLAYAGSSSSSNKNSSFPNKFNYDGNYKFNNKLNPTKPGNNSNDINKKYVHTLKNTTNINAKLAYCPRCRNNSHSLQNCKNTQLLCFKCGFKGVKKPDCPKCNQVPKN